MPMPLIRGRDTHGELPGRIFDNGLKANAAKRALLKAAGAQQRTRRLRRTGSANMACGGASSTFRAVTEIKPVDDLPRRSAVGWPSLLTKHLRQVSQYAKEDFCSACERDDLRALRSGSQTYHLLQRMLRTHQKY